MVNPTLYPSKGQFYHLSNLQEFVEIIKSKTKISLHIRRKIKYKKMKWLNKLFIPPKSPSSNENKSKMPLSHNDMLKNN